MFSSTKVRCSLEDVAENHVNSALTRGERDTVIARSLVEVLVKTNASLEMVVSAMWQALGASFGDIQDLELIKMVGRSLIDAGIECESLIVNLVLIWKAESTRHSFLSLNVVVNSLYLTLSLTRLLK